MNKYFYYGAVLIVVLLYVIGFTCGRSSHQCPEKKCPEIENIHDTIIFRDTIKQNIPRDRIVHYRDTVYDTIASGPVVSAGNCFQYTDSSRGVRAELTLCSKEFPNYKPADLYGEVAMTFPPDTQRTYRYVDTIRIKPSYKWFAIGIGPYAGYSIAKKLDFGIGASLIIKLKEF